MEVMLRSSNARDFEQILFIINDAAECYRDVIPQECWREPYMDTSTLRAEIADGVSFEVAEVGGLVCGVMGTQPKGLVTLIRHAYVARDYQHRGIGTVLIEQLLGQSSQEFLIGTWVRATWAISFYKKFSFAPVCAELREILLRRYWTVPQSQIENSVVLARPTYKGE
jgi:N-acetylglutamate synthase-like GNAT family acetyltransferase